jgi:integrase
MNITFGQQAKRFMEDGVNRTKRPFRPNTARAYQSHLNNHLISILGDLPLEVVKNKALKEINTALMAKGLKPSTISANLTLIKQIVGSAVDDEGELLHPRQWNSKHIDAPVVENLKQPTVTPEQVTEAIRRAIPNDRALYAILAGSGLRIAEAMALHSGVDDGQHTYWDSAQSKIIVRDQLSRDVYGPPKTKAGVREVDLCQELNKFLLDIGTPTDVSYLLFTGSENGYRDRLQKNGIIGGFHVFRRFRETYLENNSVPRMLMKFWTGHAAADISERYIKMGSEIEVRKAQAERVGLGFQL